MFERDEAKLGKRIGETVGGLIGREVTLKALPANARTLAPSVSAMFGAHGVRTAIRVEADLACAAAMGASIAMIPASRVKDVVAAGKLDSDLAENAQEVFNVMTRALAMDGSIRAKLDKFSAVETPAAAPAKHDLAWEVTIAGYGAGKLALTFTFKPPGSAS